MKFCYVLSFFLFLLYTNTLLSSTGQVSTASASDLVGKFKNDKEYLEALRVLGQSTHETKNRINFVKEEVLPRVSKGKVLDIGVGNGELTRVLCEHFKTLHLVDPSYRALETISQSSSPHKDIKKYQVGIERYCFPKDYYDLIVNAHTLYHIPRDRWKSVIEKSHASLKKEGLQLIVVNDGLGRRKLTDTFGDKRGIDIEKLLEDCVTLKDALVLVMPTYETFKTHSLEEILQISGVCLHDTHSSALKNILEEFLNKHFKKGNVYAIDFCQYYILIKKC